MTDDRAVINVRFRGVLGKFTLDALFEAPMKGVTGLWGPSGSGKTTLLRCLAGLDRLPGKLVVGGDVWQDGTKVFREPHKRPVGYVFQEPSLFPHLSVRKNLLFGHERALRDGVREDIRLDDVVGLMGIKHLLDRDTGSLSGGERQRVAIGRAILSQPRLLLMDEPLSALDRKNKDELLPYFEALHENLLIPMIYVSHDMRELERLADVLVVLEEGRVIASGPYADVLTDSSLPLSHTPEAVSVIEATVSGYDAEFGLTEMQIGSEKLLVPGHVGEKGRIRRIRIAAADVSLAAERPSRTSILNVLPVRVQEIRPIDEAQVNVVLTLGTTKVKLLSRISRRALANLGFVVGQAIYAQVKSVSLVAGQ